MYQKPLYPKISPRLTRIEAPHFVAGVISNEKGIVIRAAPIINYMVGWHVVRVWRYAQRKKWSSMVFQIEP